MGAKVLWWLYGNFYDGLRAFYPYRQLVQDVAQQLDVRRDMRVLDVGCGTGNVLAEIAETGCTLIGVDGSSSMLRRARRKLHAYNAAIIKDDVVSYVYDSPAQTIDRIVLSNIVYTLPPSARKVFWPALLKLLKPKGKIVIANPDRAGSSELIREHHRNDRWWRLFHPRLMGVWVVDKMIDQFIAHGSFELLSADTLLAEIKAAGGKAKIVGRTYGGAENGIDVLIVATK